MAKILVADDNSNIQRMVALALKDQGIDVVAVGNGEAAVKKISEIRPDLVLADVFMPVRNGYEVCQYVKEDPSLKHIPVILLVGAFDPLDEQEAQRVGADGVLKKPFVPPDPLIVMVKAALQRAGVSLGQGEGSREKKSPTAAPRKPADVLAFTPAPVSANPPAQAPGSPLGGLSFSRSSAPEPILVGEDSFVDTPAASEPVRIDAAEHTMAFGDLLGPTTTEEPIFTSGYETENTASVESELDEPNEVPEEQEDEESTEAPTSWRREKSTTDFRADDESGPVRDWRDLPVQPTTGRKSAIETWEESQDKGGFVTAAEVPADMGGFVTEIGTLENESANAKAEEANAAETRVEEDPQTGLLGLAQTFSSDQGPIAISEDQEATVQENFVGQHTDQNQEVSESLPEIAHLEEAARQEELARQEEAVRQAEAALREETARQDEIARQEEAARQAEIARQAEAARQEEVARQEEIAKQEEIARQEIARQAEAAQQEELARQEEIARCEEVAGQEEVARQEETARREEIARQEEAAQQKETEREPVNSWFSRPASPWDSDAKRSNPWTAALDSAKEATTDHAENISAATSNESDSANGNSSSDALATVISDLSAAEINSTHPAATQQEVDALVEKVLSKLSPEVMQAVTRELLKPVVASLVQDELKSKK